MYICNRGIDFVFVSMIVLLDFGTVLDTVVLLAFHCITYIYVLLTLLEFVE
jgi:hypothetical protein